MPTALCGHRPYAGIGPMPYAGIGPMRASAIGLLPSPIDPSTYRFSTALQTHPLAKPD